MPKARVYGYVEKFDVHDIFVTTLWSEISRAGMHSEPFVTAWFGPLHRDKAMLFKLAFGGS
jgi:hypothetical protein